MGAEKKKGCEAGENMVIPVSSGLTFPGLHILVHFGDCNLSVSFCNLSEAILGALSGVDILVFCNMQAHVGSLYLLENW